MISAEIRRSFPGRWRSAEGSSELEGRLDVVKGPGVLQGVTLDHPLGYRGPPQPARPNISLAPPNELVVFVSGCPQSSLRRLIRDRSLSYTGPASTESKSIPFQSSLLNHFKI